MKPLAEWLLKYWVIVVAVVGISGTYAADQMRMDTMEQAIKAQITQNRKVETLGQKQAAIDERTQMTLDILREQQQMLNQILLEVGRATD